MHLKPATIAVITDFGTEDGYAGAMKGRMLSECPDVRVINISHEIRPFDIRQAAFCLNNSYPFFPDKTVFVVVVDPGVGTTRRGVVIKTSQHYFVGPDNGVFSFVFQREGFQAYEINLQEFNEEISPTFHGRDVFARIAAWLADGRSLDNYLQPIKTMASFLRAPHKINENTYELEIIHIDHFGNLILNFDRQIWMSLQNHKNIHLQIKNIELKTIKSTFGDVSKNEIAMLWDSSGYLQISQNQGNAAKTLQSSVGDVVRLKI